MKEQAKSWIDSAFSDLLLIEEICDNELYIEARYPTDLGLLPNGKPSIEIANQFYLYAKKLYK